MTNFGRLLRFAWPYRVRFVLSLACAGLVAVMWGGNFGAVYPLLQILFRSQNCQHWIAERVESTTTDVLVNSGRLEEITFLESLGGPTDAALPPHFKDLAEQRQVESARQRRLQEDQLKQLASAAGDDGAAARSATLEVTLPEAQTRPLRVVEGRIDELDKALEARSGATAATASATGGRAPSGTSTTRAGGTASTSGSSRGSTATCLTTASTPCCS